MLLYLLANIEQRFLQIEVCDQKVVDDFVLVGEDEVVEAGLRDIVRHLRHGLLDVVHGGIGSAVRVAVQRDVVDQTLATGQSLLTAGPV